jgi:hypothetical protein
MTGSAVPTPMERISLLSCLAAALVAGAVASSSFARPVASRELAATTRPDLAAKKIVRQWRADLRSSALADPKRRFANPSRATLLERLRLAGARNHLDIVKVQLLHPRQAAPLVIVKAADKRALAAATPAILRLIDPKAHTGDDRTGWAYEGFLFEAVDHDGIPFLIVFNNWRGSQAGGGQWASDPSLFPFAHG